MQIPIAPELAALLQNLHLGPPIAHGDLTLVPLFAETSAEGGGPDADLLEEGLAGGVTRVSEVSQSGVVARVRVSHRGTRPLLLVDGEQILGAKQNRIVNASFLVAPGVDVEVPVSCVERGRWHGGGGFRSAESTLVGSARFEKLKRVTRSTLTGRGYDADQGQVWRDVDTYLERTDVRSHTASYADAYERRRAEVDTAVQALAPAEGQIGIAALRGEQLLGLDVFGSTRLYRRAHAKVLRGLLAEVPNTTTPPSSQPHTRVRDTLSTILRVTITRATGPGGGETLHGQIGTTVVGAVVSGGVAYHAAIAG